jgi:Zn-dependent protease with chaperone function
MTFFQDQAKARQRTSLLVLLYIGAIVLIVGTIYLGIAMLFMRSENEYMPTSEAMSLWHPQLFLGTSIAVLSIIGLGTIYRLIQLARGGVAVAEALGGRLLSYDTQIPEEKKILNVVEEIAIASGVRIPQVYLLDHEDSINAFAAGYKPDAAVIGISRGCLNYLNRDELQGVVAHEFSHILNGDMRLNIRLMSVLHGILMLTLAGRILVRSGFTSGRRRRDGDRDGGSGLVAVGAVFLVVGMIGVLAARIIKMAVSRQREFLADASAVQFTRQPEGIAGALQKIGGLAQGSVLNSPKAEDISHLCFSNAISSFFSSFSLFSTHPPLAERIKRIDGRFDGTFPAVEPLRLQPQQDEVSTAAKAEQRQPAITDIFTPDNLIKMVGTMPAAAMVTSQSLLASIPEQVSKAAHNPMDAAGLVCALFVADEAVLQKEQLEAISVQVPQAVLEIAREQISFVSQMRRDQLLPALDMAIASLRHLSQSQYLQLRLAVDTLIKADGSVSLFEFSLFRILTRSLDEHFGLKQKPGGEEKNLSKLLLPTSQVLYALAFAGTEDPALARNAYHKGCDELGISAEARLNAEDADAIDTSFIDAALSKLEFIAPHVQEKILHACLSVILFDEEVTDAERELVRAVSETLECPLPRL